MIRKKSSCRMEEISHMQGGIGSFRLEHLAEHTELADAVRLFAVGTLLPGCSVGWHVHSDTTEICWFVSGTGTVVEDADVRCHVEAGDTHICPAGSGHEIINDSNAPLSYLCVVLNV